MTPETNPLEQDPRLRREVFRAPAGYFDGLEAAVMARMQGEVPLRGALAQASLRHDILPAPAGYFASFPARMVDRVRSLRRPALVLPELTFGLRIALPAATALVLIVAVWLQADISTQPAGTIAETEILRAVYEDIDAYDVALLAESMSAPVQQARFTANEAEPARAAKAPASDPAAASALRHDSADAPAAEPDAAADAEVERRQLEEYLARRMRTDELIDILQQPS